VHGSRYAARATAHHQQRKFARAYGAAFKQTLGNDHGANHLVANAGGAQARQFELAWVQATSNLMGR